jgi:hypothetical protein
MLEWHPVSRWPLARKDLFLEITADAAVETYLGVCQFGFPKPGTMPLST